MQPWWQQGWGKAMPALCQLSAALLALAAPWQPGWATAGQRHIPQTSALPATAQAAGRWTLGCRGPRQLPGVQGLCTTLAHSRQRQGRRGRQQLSGLQGLASTLWHPASNSRRDRPSQACHRKQLWRHTSGRQGWALSTQAVLPVPGAQPPPTAQACSSSSNSSRCSLRGCARPAAAVGWPLTGASILRTGMSVARFCPMAATALQRGLVAVQQQQRRRRQGLRRRRPLMRLHSGHRVSAGVCLPAG